MSQTKPIPVRLNQQVLDRLDTVVENTGLDTRTEIIKLCLILFLNALEQNDYRLPNWDFKELVRMMDGRTYRYRGKTLDQKQASQTKGTYSAKKEEKDR